MKTTIIARSSSPAPRRFCPAASTARSARSRRSAASPLFIQRALGRDARGRRRQPVHRLRDVVGPADPRPRAARPGQGDRRGRAARHELRRAEPARSTSSASACATLMPSIERVRFVSSGTEAAMSAVRVARAATGRDRIIKFEGCYHGHADAFLVKAGSGATDARRADQPGRRRARSPPTRCSRATTTSRRSTRCSTPTAIRSRPSIVEPIAGNMGVVPPADGFLRGLRERCTRHGSAADLRRGDLRLPRRRPAARRRCSASRRT